LINPENLLGRTKQQVMEFLKLEVEPLLKENLNINITLPSFDI